MAYAGIDGPALNLAAYRARLSDLSWSSADLSLRPVPISVGTHRRVRLGLAFRSLYRLSFTAQLLHAGAYGQKIVLHARSGCINPR